MLLVPILIFTSAKKHIELRLLIWYGESQEKAYFEDEQAQAAEKVQSDASSETHLVFVKGSSRGVREGAESARRFHREGCFVAFFIAFGWDVCCLSQPNG